MKVSDEGPVLDLRGDDFRVAERGSNDRAAFGGGDRGGERHAERRPGEGGGEAVRGGESAGVAGGESEPAGTGVAEYAGAGEAAAYRSEPGRGEGSADRADERVSDGDAGGGGPDG